MRIYDNKEKLIKLPNGPQHGMYEALRDLGILMEGGEAGEFASDPKVAQAFIDSWTDQMSLDWATAKKNAEISAYATEQRNKAITGMSPVEIAGWIVKQVETKDLSAAPYLDKEAQARGISVSDLAAKVQSKFSAYMDKESQIAGISGKHRDAIAQLPDADSIMAYDYSIGWP